MYSTLLTSVRVLSAKDLNSLKIQVEILRPTGIGCENRDDTGAPKTMQFGGYNRNVISPQCQKRAMKEALAMYEIFKSVFTREFFILWQGYFHEYGLTTREQEVITKLIALSTVCKEEKAEKDKPAKKKNSEGEDEPGEQAASLAHMAVCEVENIAKEFNELKKAGTVFDSVNPELIKKSRSLVEKVMGKNAHIVRGIAIYIFGRMMAANPRLNVDGTLSVAFATSTHRSANEIDMFTATDDLVVLNGGQGAGHLSVNQYTSACYYHYFVLDWGTLNEYLKDFDQETKIECLRVFFHETILSTPSGKKRAAFSACAPEYVRIRIGTNQTFSMIPAFSIPVPFKGESSICDRSIVRLKEFYENKRKMFPDEVGQEIVYEMPSLNLTELVNKVCEHAKSK